MSGSEDPQRPKATDPAQNTTPMSNTPKRKPLWPGTSSSGTSSDPSTANKSLKPTSASEQHIPRQRATYSPSDSSFPEYLPNGELVVSPEPIQSKATGEKEAKKKMNPRTVSQQNRDHFSGFEQPVDDREDEEMMLERNRNEIFNDIKLCGKGRKKGKD